MAGNNRDDSSFPNVGEQRKFPRLSLAKSDPEVQSMISKLVSDKASRPNTASGNRAINVPEHTWLTKISELTSNNINDAKSLFQLLPDTELSMQILVSCILSPKDMVNTDLTYTVESTAITPETIGAMLQVVEDYFDKTYKIKSLLQPMLEDMLFLAGSYPLLVLPENTIDEAINGPGRVSMESLRSDLTERGVPRAMGFLGPSVKSTADALSLENLITPLDIHGAGDIITKMTLTTESGKTINPYLEVSDNPSLLKMGMLRDKIRQDRIQDILSVGKVSMEARRDNLMPKVSMEAKGDLSMATPDSKKKYATTGDMEASLYRKRRYKNVPVFSLTPSDMLEKRPVGHPLVMKLPSESVIPVHVPSNPEQHLGYFVLLDEMGNPLYKANNSDFYTDLSTNINSSTEMVSQLIATTKRAERGREDNNEIDSKQIIKAYTDLVEEDLLNRLRNGAYGADVEIARPTEVYRVMFARAMEQMHTRLLYVPSELMTYMAFDYNQHGIGSSLLEKNKILGGMRAIMLFASTMASVKNSVGRVSLNITLDPNDPDPSKTVEFMIHEHAKTRQASYPLGASNPVDIVSFMENAGVQVAVSGNTAYPETKLEVEDKISNKAKPDTELMEDLKNSFIMSLGLSPETVNMGAGAEFATTVVQSNLLLTKRVMQYQEKFTVLLLDFIQKYILYSGALMDELREVIVQSKKAAKVAKRKEEQEAKDKEEKDAADEAANADQTPAATSTTDAGTDATTPGDTPPDNPPADGDAADNDTAKPGDDTSQYDNLPDMGIKPKKPKPKDDKDDKDKPTANEKIAAQTQDDENDLGGEDGIIMEFIRGLQVHLPSPDTVTLKTQMESYVVYRDALDEALKAYIDVTFLSDITMGELAPAVETTVAVIRSYFLRQWLRTNGVMTELDVLTNMGSDEEFNLLELQQTHIEGLLSTVGEFMDSIKEALEKKQLAAAANFAANGGQPGQDEFGNPTGGSGDDMGAADPAGQFSPGAPDAAAAGGDMEDPDADADQSESDTDTAGKGSVAGDDVAV
jgi:hypothetical protein